MNRTKLKRKNVLNDKKDEDIVEEKSREAETLSGYESDEVKLNLSPKPCGLIKCFYFQDFLKEINNASDESESDDESNFSFESYNSEDSGGLEEDSELGSDTEQKRIEELVEFRKRERIEQKNISKAISETLRPPDDESFLAMRENVSKPSFNVQDGEEGTSSKITEYEDDGDTSDEEDIRNTIGNVPLHWYDEYKHTGYDWDGKKIIKPPKKDQLDDFLSKMEDPDFWRTVIDPQTGQKVVLSEDDIELIKQVRKQKNPQVGYDSYEPFIEWFTSEVEKLPIRNIPDSKASFLPSKTERKQIGRLVHSLKMGFIKTEAEKKKLEAEKKAPKFYMLWDTDTGREKMRRIHDHVTAPKRALPGHAESYNPPAEYLFNEQEKKDWESQEAYKRKLHFVPQKYKSLRQVPYYGNYVKERFIRCLDLYLCPRAKRMKVTVQPEDLIPKLPSPKDLQPFPTVQSMLYKGHTDLVRAISIDPKGQYIVTGSDDNTVKIWEISTGRCMRTFNTKGVVRSVAWCPSAKLSLIAVASDKRCILINPYVGDIKLSAKKTDDILAEAPVSDRIENEKLKVAVQWSSEIPEDEYKDGVRIIINHFQEIKQVTWHGKGDYFATVMPNGLSRSVIIHQLSKRNSQTAFSKPHGMVQCVLFHPIKPWLFVAVSVVLFKSLFI